MDSCTVQLGYNDMVFVHAGPDLWGDSRTFGHAVRGANKLMMRKGPSTLIVLTYTWIGLFHLNPVQWLIK